MEFSPENTSFYFIYRYELNRQAFRTAVDAAYEKLHGGLCHDDLVSFSKCIFDRFSIIRKRISLRYQRIFIDEYQDTMADVLNIFYDAVANTNSQLYLFSDRM